MRLSATLNVPTMPPGFSNFGFLMFAIFNSYKETLLFRAEPESEKAIRVKP